MQDSPIDFHHLGFLRPNKCFIILQLDTRRLDGPERTKCRPGHTEQSKVVSVRFRFPSQWFMHRLCLGCLGIYNGKMTWFMGMSTILLSSSQAPLAYSVEYLRCICLGRLYPIKPPSSGRVERKQCYYLCWSDEWNETRRGRQAGWLQLSSYFTQLVDYYCYYYDYDYYCYCHFYSQFGI